MQISSDSAENRGALFAALAQAQGEFLELKRTKTVNTGKYKFDYCPLEEILAMVRPVLSRHGLFVGQFIDTESDPDTKTKIDVLITLITHANGAAMTSIFRIPEFQEMQGLGSDITYLRRYCLASALGLAPEEDDDGNKLQAQETGPKEKVRRGGDTQKNTPPATPDAKATSPETPSQKDMENLRLFMESAGYETREQRAEKYMKVTGKTPQAMTKTDIANLIKVIEGEAILAGKA